jgi:hypothetical protein
MIFICNYQREGNISNLIIFIQCREKSRNDRQKDRQTDGRTEVELIVPTARPLGYKKIGKTDKGIDLTIVMYSA